MNQDKKIIAIVEPCRDLGKEIALEIYVSHGGGYTTVTVGSIEDAKRCCPNPDLVLINGDVFSYQKYFDAFPYNQKVAYCRYWPKDGKLVQTGSFAGKYKEPKFWANSATSFVGTTLEEAA